MYGQWPASSTAASLSRPSTTSFGTSVEFFLAYVLRRLEIDPNNRMSHPLNACLRTTAGLEASNDRLKGGNGLPMRHAPTRCGRVVREGEEIQEVGTLVKLIFERLRFVGPLCFERT